MMLLVAVFQNGSGLTEFASHMFNVSPSLRSGEISKIVLHRRLADEAPFFARMPISRTGKSHRWGKPLCVAAIALHD